MNTGFPCKCGCSRTHARLKKIDSRINLEMVCMGCGSTFDTDIDLDGSFIDWGTFKKKYHPEDLMLVTKGRET